MKSVVRIKSSNKMILPEQYRNDDVRFSDELVKYFLSEFTNEGDVVFDPFCGFGTTLVVSEAMKRIGYGIEYLEDRVDYIKSVINNKDNVICGSSLEMNKYSLPMIDFSISSPPYMSKNDHLQYPFAGYQINGKNYDDYLEDIKKIYTLLKPKLKSGAYIVIEISNIINNEVVTTLAFDVCKVVSEVFTFIKEIVLIYEDATNVSIDAFGYNHAYGLVFKNE